MNEGEGGRRIKTEKLEKEKGGEEKEGRRVVERGIVNLHHYCLVWLLLARRRRKKNRRNTSYSRKRILRRIRLMRSDRRRSWSIGRDRA